MAAPRVYAIYWDAYFKQTPKAVARMNQFLRQILRGRFVQQLRQYGVGKGEFIGSKVVIPDPQNPPPRSLRRDYIEAQLKSWIIDGIVKVKPALHETNLLYVIFTPNDTNIGTGIGGCHDSGRYGKPSGDDNLLWAAIQEWHYKPHAPTPQQFADSCTWCVSHEMVEAFTDRDGYGYKTAADCEIGDICEAAGNGSDVIEINTVRIDGWLVEPYWDNQNRSCYPSCANGGDHWRALSLHHSVHAG